MDIQFRNLTKSFDGNRALDSLDFDAAAGRITGFVGRNGAGKTTALRILLGLAAPDEGSATYGGRPLRELAAGTVGALVGAAAHPGRTGRAHLRAMAAAIGRPAADVDAVLRDTDLVAAADRRVRTYSLGMRQRLALAAALLGNPRVLVLDEPMNGLDPDGIAWLRQRLATAARDGATVLVSSHLLAELEAVVDDIVVVDRRTLWAGSRDEALAQSPDGTLGGLYHHVATGAAA